MLKFMEFSKIVKYGNLDQIKELFENKNIHEIADVMFENAILSGNIEVVKYIQEKTQINLTYFNTKKNIMLQCLNAKQQQIELMKYFEGQNIQIIDSENQLLENALRSDQFNKIVKFLTEKGKEKEKEKDNENFLEIAAKYTARYAAIQNMTYLISQMDEQSAKTKNWNCVVACYYGDIDAFQQTYQYLIDVNFAVLFAAKNGHLEILKIIIEKNTVDQKIRENAILKAAENGHLNVIEFLEKNNTEIPEEIYIRAIQGNQIEVLKYAFDKNIRVKWLGILDEYKLLNFATRSNDFNIFSLVFQKYEEQYKKCRDVNFGQLYACTNIDILDVMYNKVEFLETVKNYQLFQSVIAGNKIGVKFWLSKGANMSEKECKSVRDMYDQTDINILECLNFLTWKIEL